MICPHCSTAIKISFYGTEPLIQNEDEDDEIGLEIIYNLCPNCEEIIIFLHKGEREFTGGRNTIADPDLEIMIYPSQTRLLNPSDIPDLYLDDYEESLKVISASPKSSAALCRRLLQNIIREEYNIKENTLYKEIQKFTELPGIPSHITEAVDAIRHIGNIAAHPTKNLNTGEIVPVEKGEAEWLIEVIEALFDFTFIQPLKLERRKNELNLKLEEIKSKNN